MTFDEKRANQQAHENMITITELADVLARDYGVSFRTAHHKASIVSKEADKINQELYQLSLKKVNEWIEIVELSQEDWNGVVDPTYFVKRRKDRKSTRLNSSHVAISYAVFCLKKKKERICQ